MDNPKARQFVEVASDAAASFAQPEKPAGSGRPALNVVRWIYAHNPFYVISAALVFWGLRSSFDIRATDFHTHALMLGLVAYTLLLAVTTFLVIRFGKIWEDGRSQLLLIVLMFLGISVSFDDALAVRPEVGMLCNLGGLLFAALTTEGLLLGLPLRMRALFRVPYYLILSLFFLAPIVLRFLSDDPFDPTVQWGLLAFPAVAGAVFLSLLPAVRRGPEYVVNNGSPWRWPWYPWVVFVLLGLGICQRSLYLCVSMHQAGGVATIFAPYFLVPFLLAAAVLLLEIGLVSRSANTLRAALLVPVGLLVLAMIPTAGKTPSRFLAMFEATLGASPLFFTLLAACLFYAWAFLRGVPYAAGALAAALAATSVVAPATRDLASLAEPRGLPLLLVGVLQAAMLLRSRNSAQVFLAACCVVAAAALEWQGTAFAACHNLIPQHLVLATVLVIGALFHDAFAKFLQYVGAPLILLAGILSMFAGPHWLEGLSEVWLILHPAILVLVAVGYGYLVRNRLYYAAAAVTVALWLAIRGWWGYGYARDAVSGLSYVVWGLLSFLVAVFISVLKMGLPQRWFARWTKNASKSATASGRGDRPLTSPRSSPAGPGQRPS